MRVLVGFLSHQCIRLSSPQCDVHMQQKISPALDQVKGWQQAVNPAIDEIRQIGPLIPQLMTQPRESARQIHESAWQQQRFEQFRGSSAEATEAAASCLRSNAAVRDCWPGGVGVQQLLAQLRGARRQELRICPQVLPQASGWRDRRTRHLQPNAGRRPLWTQRGRQEASGASQSRPLQTHRCG